MQALIRIARIARNHDMTSCKRNSSPRTKAGSILTLYFWNHPVRGSFTKYTPPSSSVGNGLRMGEEHYTEGQRVHCRRMNQRHKKANNNEKIMERYSDLSSRTRQKVVGYDRFLEREREGDRTGNKKRKLLENCTGKNWRETAASASTIRRSGILVH